MRTILLASTLFVLSAVAADLTGNWSGEAQAEGESHPLYFVLKQDGTTLTGTGGPTQSEQHPIQNGKIDAGKMSFDIPVGDKGTIHFELSADGDGLKGAVQRKSDEVNQSGTVSLKRLLQAPHV
jgi:hypothetical protein